MGHLAAGVTGWVLGYRERPGGESGRAWENRCGTSLLPPGSQLLGRRKVTHGSWQRRREQRGPWGSFQSRTRCATCGASWAVCTSSCRGRAVAPSSLRPMPRQQGRAPVQVAGLGLPTSESSWGSDGDRILKSQSQDGPSPGGDPAAATGEESQRPLPHRASLGPQGTSQRVCMAGGDTVLQLTSRLPQKGVLLPPSGASHSQGERLESLPPPCPHAHGWAHTEHTEK